MKHLFFALVVRCLDRIRTKPPSNHSTCCSDEADKLNFGEAQVGRRIERNGIGKSAQGPVYRFDPRGGEGIVLGFSVDGLEKFMIDELPKSMQKYALAMNEYVIDGIGSFVSILFMYANRTLFDSALDDSRLDKYYMKLMSTV
ncbi:hypothetical protein EZV62_016117 [Acer yangbiense]|uniref:Uncharacterized protein n=1 Tax=Acer yangbiense TaxID=1000413 RepID=A0A5C7HND5_9ROSI|nr:hypothetical protein EZV62_016117 [Acer yangbiense]